MRAMSNANGIPLLAALLAACHGDSTPAPAPVQKPHVKFHAAAQPGQTSAQMTAGMVEAVTMGNATAPVDVKFTLATRPAVGQPLEIVLVVVPQVAGTASLQFTGSDGLELAAGAGSTDIPSVDPTQAYRVTVAATPTAGGVQLLGLTVSLTHDGGTEARTFSVPIIVTAGD